MSSTLAFGASALPGAVVSITYGAKFVVLALSLTIAYLAFHGYRRNGSAPMLYVSSGFVFIGTGTVCQGMLYDLADVSLSSAGLVQACLVSIGMMLVLASLRL
jgi:hypothetical protein